jgi:hypothetical protein
LKTKKGFTRNVADQKRRRPMKESDFTHDKAKNHRGGRHHRKVHKTPDHTSKTTHHGSTHEQSSAGTQPRKEVTMKNRAKFLAGLAVAVGFAFSSSFAFESKAAGFSRVASVDSATAEVAKTRVDGFNVSYKNDTNAREFEFTAGAFGFDNFAVRGSEFAFDRNANEFVARDFDSKFKSLDFNFDGFEALSFKSEFKTSDFASAVFNRGFEPEFVTFNFGSRFDTSFRGFANSRNV